MLFDFLNSIKNTNEENKLLYSIIENITDLKEAISGKLEREEKGELYYVYSYTPKEIYITKQNNSKLELLEGVTEEFKNNLAEGYILRYKDGKYSVDKKLTEKSMNFELDFDNYKE